MPATKYVLDAASRALLIDIGLSPANVLRRAGLPADLLSRGSVTLPQAEYFALWNSIEAEADDPNVPLRIAKAFSAEVFGPLIFAALVSPNLAVAAQRVAKYKQLISPTQVQLSAYQSHLRIDYIWDENNAPPPALALTELLFWTALARLGTRHRTEPTRVTTPFPPAEPSRYRDYLGVDIVAGDSHSVIFSADSAHRPFLTANEALWETFEPDLRKRLSDLDSDAAVAERVHSALLELLPSGETTMESVAARLAMSKRTLHRRLRAEDTSFQKILNATRESLARHYLDQDVSAGEISFLLGYEEPSSFYRAFQSWTGQTPERARAAASTHGY